MIFEHSFSNGNRVAIDLTSVRYVVLEHREDASEITFHFKGLIKSDNSGLVFNGKDHETRSNNVYEEILKGLKGENTL